MFRDCAWFVVLLLKVVEEETAIIQCTVDYPCGVYLLCRLSMRSCQLVMTNDEGGK